MCQTELIGLICYSFKNVLMNNLFCKKKYVSIDLLKKKKKKNSNSKSEAVLFNLKWNGNPNSSFDFLN